MLGSLKSPLFQRAATDQENSSTNCPTLRLQPHPGGPAQTLSSQLAVPHRQQAHNLTAVQGNRWMLLGKVKNDTAERQPQRKSHRGTQGYLYCNGEVQPPRHSPCSAGVLRSLHAAWEGSQCSEPSRAHMANWSGKDSAPSSELTA